MNNLDNAYALLIGVGDDLPDTIRDATAIYNILVDDKLAGYKEENVLLITNEKADRKGILEAFDFLVKNTNEDSSVLLFYSGHGGQYELEDESKYFLQPYGMIADQYEETWVSAEELKEKINNIASKRLVFFLDCCHAEGMTKGGFFSNKGSSNSEDKKNNKATENPEGLAQKIDNDKGISIVSSCREDQLSYILDGDKNSLFTKCLLQVLKAEHKQHFEEDYIRISEVIQFIFRKVPELEPRQRPYVNLQIYDDFVLSYIPKEARKLVNPKAQESNKTENKNEITQKSERKEIVTSFRKTEGATNLLLFIHGFSGEASDTYGKIPEMLCENSKMDGWDMLPLGYSQYVKPELGKDIWAAVEDVNKIADYLVTSFKYKFEKYNRIAIVGHSLGGLVAQRALIEIPEKLRSKLSHVLLFGTPSAGIDSELLTRLWNNKYAEMSSDGPFIKKLREDWNTTFKDPYPFKLKVVGATNDEFVSNKSCYSSFKEEHHVTISGSHLTMIKPNDENTDCYNLILDTLTGNKFYNKYTNREEINLALGKYDAVVKELLPKVKSISQNGLKQLIFSLEGLDRKDEALEILNNHPSAKSDTDLMGIIGGRYKRQYLNSFSKNDGDTSFSYYSKALALATKEENHNQIYYHAINLAFLSIAFQNNESKMLMYAKQALTSAKECRDNLWKYATIAEANMYIGNMKKAKKFYSKAAKLAGVRQKISIHTNAYNGYISVMQMDDANDKFIKFLKSSFLS
ncbi:MAG: caspase family protein [Psychroserpens sp.]|uniref:caspase family protein n=1 Tax=Psychroserpens sp. TaxID=2020870 RepID=UPI003002D191